MNNRADEIRRRMKKKKKDMERQNRASKKQMVLQEDEERYGFPSLPKYEGHHSSQGFHPLFRKEVFLFKLLAAACLFLVVGILFKNDAPVFDGVKGFVQTTMEKDFQFAQVASWYEDTFGKPLALLPVQKNDGQAPTEVEFALPASAKILEEFDESGKRILVETAKDEPVLAMSDGYIKFAGYREGFGETVIVLHQDDSESWYGNLETIDVKYSQHIEKGTKIGVAEASDDQISRSFYFAIKKEETFVDPLQVIGVE